MKIKVIIIDDHTLFREGLQRLLTRHEIDVVTSVSNGVDGLKAISDSEVDIILLDLRMPDVSGIEVLKNIREIKKSLPVVMLTTSDDEKDLIEALRNGASGYLLKDMEPDDLVVALKDVLKGATEDKDCPLNLTNMNVTLYSARHYYVTQQIMEGTDHHAIGRQVGTGTKYIDDHYSHLIPEMKQEQICNAAANQENIIVKFRK